MASRLRHISTTENIIGRNNILGIHYVSAPAPAVIIESVDGAADQSQMLLDAFREAAAQGWIVYLLGTFTWGTSASESDPSTWLPNGLRLRGFGHDRSIIRSTLTPEPVHQHQNNSPLYSFGFRDGDGQFHAQLTAPIAIGDTVIHVTSVLDVNGQQLALGTNIEIQAASGNESHLEQFTVKAVNAGALTITLNRPTCKSYLVNNLVLSTPGAYDIEISDLTISGTGDRAIELICARNVVIDNVRVDGRFGAFQYFSIGLDYGGTNCVVRDCYVDVIATDGSGGVGGACYAFENGYNCWLLNSEGYGAQAQIVLFSQEENSGIRGGSFQGGSGSCVGVQCSNGADVDAGCSSITIDGADIAACDVGVLVADVSTNVTVANCNVRFNRHDGIKVGPFGTGPMPSTRVPSLFQLLGGAVHDNGTSGAGYGCLIDTATRNLATSVTFSGNASDLVHGIHTQNGGAISASNCIGN